MMARAVAISGLAAIGLGGCADPRPVQRYQVVDALRIDADILNVLVETSGDMPQETADRFAECVAARYALDEGLGFARHIRTNRSKTGGNWSADAVYSITPALPRGARTMDAEVVVQDCIEQGIPTG